jgi:hypothetical protein
MDHAKRKKMMKGRYGMMYGGEYRMKKGHGGFASISDMEKACSNRTGRNTMRQKYEESK